MMAVSRDPAQWTSDLSALAVTATACALLLGTAPRIWRDSALAPASSSPPSIEVSLEQAPAQTAPAPGPPPPVPQKVPAHRVTPQPLLRAARPVAAVPVNAPAPAQAGPVPDDGALVASPTPSPSSAPPSDGRPDLEAQYVAGLRADIDRRTRAPDSAQYRLHHPAGEVRVGFTVLRSGESRSVHLLRSSASSILDDAALTIVAQGHYSPMPAKAFAGEAEHEFSVTIEFRPAG